MELTNVDIVLNVFAKRVIKQARTNLTKKKKELKSGDLYNSLKFNPPSIDQGSVILKFLMEAYGKFQDAGVYGSNPSLVKEGIQKGRSTNTIFEKYSYKSKMPPLAPLEKWAKANNIRFRDPKTGRFEKGNYKTIGFWLQKRIFAQGLSPTLFFSKPFRKAFETLPDQLAKAYRLDIESGLNTKK